MPELRVKVFQTVAVTFQRAGIEHCLRGLFAHQCDKAFEECAELWRTNAHDQAGVGAELARTQHHGGAQLGSDLVTASLEGFGHQQHRVDAAHLGEHRDRLRPRRCHVAQGPTAAQGAGEPDGLNRRVFDQCFTDAAVKQAEHAIGHTGFFRRAGDRIGNVIGGGHVAAVGLEHHGAAGSER